VSNHSGRVEKARGCRVLVVEDDPDLREMMAQLLTLEGFESEVAVNGQDALEKAQTYRPKVIVLDLMMPVMDGWAFRVHQRLDPVIASIPVVVLSAAPPERLVNIGAEAVLQKPFDYEQLLTAVRDNC
jgi:CheY-like chemotaxis protein